MPLLMTWLGYAQRDARSWSLGAIVPIASAGLVSYALAEQVRLDEATVLGAGTLIGAALGADALERVSGRVLEGAFALRLLATAALMGVTS